MRDGGDLGDAALGAHMVELVHKLLRRRDAGDERLVELVAHHVAAQQRLILPIREVLIGENRLIDAAVEDALLIAEGRVRENGLTHCLVADGKAEMADLEIDEVAVDEPLQRGVDDAELLELLGAQLGAAEHAADPLGVLADLAIELLRVDLAIADPCDGRVDAAIAEDVADAPDPEGDDQQTEQDLDDDRAGLGADDLQHDGSEGCGGIKRS